MRGFASRDSHTLPQRYAHAVCVRRCAVLTASTAHIPLFLYPFLNTVSKTRPFEYLRLTSLGVIGALVKVRTPLAHLALLHLAHDGIIIFET